MKRTWVLFDPWVLVVGAVALLTYALHGIHGQLTRDLGIYSYAGERFAHGVPPYVAVVNRAGPLAHILPGIGAIFARLAGLDSLLTMRVLFMLFAVASVGAMFVLAKDLFRSRTAGLVAAAAMLSFHGFIQYASNGPREKTPMTLFLICTLWAVTRRRWFTAGLFVSLATLCLQISFFPAVVAALLGALTLIPRARWQAVGKVLLGGAIPPALYLVYAAVVGAVAETVTGFLLLNMSYTPADSMSPSRFHELWVGMHLAYGSSIWVLVAGLVALLALAPLAFVGPFRAAHPWAPEVAVFAVAAVAAAAWTWHDYDAWPDLFPLLPFAALGVGALFALLPRRLPAAARTVTAAVLCVAMLATAVGYSVTARNDELRVQQRSVDAVLGQLPPGTRVLSIEAPQPLVLANKINPTRYQMVTNGMWDYIDHVWPGGLFGYRWWIRKSGPPLVALSEGASTTWQTTLNKDYELVGGAPQFWWYARRDLGADTLNRLREAAADAARRSAPDYDR